MNENNIETPIESEMIEELEVMEYNNIENGDSDNNFDSKNLDEYINDIGINEKQIETVQSCSITPELSTDNSDSDDDFDDEALDEYILKLEKEEELFKLNEIKKQNDKKTANDDYKKSPKTPNQFGKINSANIDIFIESFNEEERQKLEASKLIVEEGKIRTFCPACKIKLLKDINLQFYQCREHKKILLCPTQGCQYPFNVLNEKTTIKNEYWYEEVIENYKKEKNKEVEDIEKIRNKVKIEWEVLKINYKRLKEKDYGSVIENMKKYREGDLSFLENEEIEMENNDEAATSSCPNENTIDSNSNKTEENNVNDNGQVWDEFETDKLYEFLNSLE